MITVLDHRDRQMASMIYAIQIMAYAQEAALLGVTRFAPLDETADDIQRADAVYFGAWMSGALLGALSVEAPDGEEGERLIGALVVSPMRQRIGVGRRLLEAALERFGRYGVRVSTGVKNAPALALYTGYGFVPYEQLTLGEEEPVEVVRLRRVHEEAR